MEDEKISLVGILAFIPPEDDAKGQGSQAVVESRVLVQGLSTL